MDTKFIFDTFYSFSCALFRFWNVFKEIYLKHPHQSHVVCVQTIMYAGSD